jgi:hypothetical protein
MLRASHNDITSNHIANSSTYALPDDSGERVVSPELRPTRSPDLKEHQHISVNINVKFHYPEDGGGRIVRNSLCQPTTIYDLKTLRLPSEVLLTL